MVAGRERPFPTIVSLPPPPPTTRFIFDQPSHVSFNYSNPLSSLISLVSAIPLAHSFRANALVDGKPTDFLGENH